MGGEIEFTQDRHVLSDAGEGLLRRAGKSGTPLIDGEKVTFLWQGTQPAQLIGDFNYWAMNRHAWTLQQLGPELWGYTVTLPEDAYVEYAFLRDGQRIPDPLNVRTVTTGMGDTNSYFWMPRAVDTPLAIPQAGIPAGTVTVHAVRNARFVVGGERTVRLYQPPVEEPCPLLVVFDGADFLQQAHLATITDTLIAQRRIRPIALAMVDSSSLGRTTEYACNDATVAFVVHVVLPLARQQLRVLDVQEHPGAYGLMGASMGGLMSLYTALRAPEILASVLSLSGAFGADHLYYRSVIYDLIRHQEPPPIKIWMDAGLHEWFVHPNRDMADLLRMRGYDVQYSEHHSGHNYVSWRNSLWRGLEFLYGSTESQDTR